MFRKVFVTVAVALWPFATNAQPSAKRDCALEGAWAELAMQARQMGVPIGDQMALARPELGGSKIVLRMAYKFPRYETPKRRAKAAIDFGSQIKKSCRHNSK